MTQLDEHQLIEAGRRALQRALDGLDTSTRMRLQRARYRALDAFATSPMRRTWGVTAGAVAVAGAALVLATVLWFSPAPELRSTRLSEVALGDLDLLATTDSLEFYADLEFYDWLEDPHAG